MNLCLYRFVTLFTDIDHNRSFRNYGGTKVLGIFQQKIAQTSNNKTSKIYGMMTV